MIERIILAVKSVRNKMANRCPRSTRDKGKPYMKCETAGDGSSQQTEHQLNA